MARRVKLNWGHIAVISLGVFALFIMGLILYFSHTMQNSEMVSANYYEDELFYQKVIDAKKAASALRYKPELVQNKKQIRIVFPKDSSVESKVSFVLFRTDDANLDKTFSVFLDKQNSFAISREFLVFGSYTLRVMWRENQKDYELDYNFQWS